MPNRVKAPRTWYIYTYAFPDGTVFYVGKGNRGRIDVHEHEAQTGCPCMRCCAIRQIWESGQPVQKRIVYETLLESDAIEYERSLINQYTGPQLTNINGNWLRTAKSRSYRPRPLRIIARKIPSIDKETDMTPEEASALLGVSRRTLERYVDTGRISKHHHGKHAFYHRSEIERLKDDLSRIYPLDESLGRKD